MTQGYRHTGGKGCSKTKGTRRGIGVWERFGYLPRAGGGGAEGLIAQNFTQITGADTGFPEGGISQAAAGNAPPPLDIVCVTSFALRKIEKHPPPTIAAAPKKGPPLTKKLSCPKAHKHPPPLGGGGAAAPPPLPPPASYAYAQGCDSWQATRRLSCRMQTPEWDKNTWVDTEYTLIRNNSVALPIRLFILAEQILGIRHCITHIQPETLCSTFGFAMLSSGY